MERDIEGEGAALEPGVYTWSGFEPHVTFELGDGWEGGHTRDDFFDVWNGGYVGFARPVSLVTGGGERIDAAGLDPAATIAAIEGRDGLDGTEPVRTAVGGATGWSIEVTAPEDVPLFDLEGEEDDVPVPAGWWIRYRAVDVDGVTVLVVTGMPEPVDLALLRQADDVAHTVEWGGIARPLPMGGDGTPLEPGAYHHPGYEPGMSFDVGEGWTGGHLHDEFFDVQREAKLVGFADPAYLIRGDGRTVPARRLDKAGAVAILTEALGVQAASECPYFQELRAVCVDVQPDGSIEVLGGPDGRLGIGEGSWNRFVVLEIDDDVVMAVVLMLDGLDQTFLDAADDVLATARWG